MNVKAIATVSLVALALASSASAQTGYGNGTFRFMNTDFQIEQHQTLENGVWRPTLGARIASVPGWKLSQAGLRLGDWITKLDGQPVSSSNDLINYVKVPTQFGALNTGVTYFRPTQRFNFSGAPYLDLGSASTVYFQFPDPQNSLNQNQNNQNQSNWNQNNQNQNNQNQNNQNQSNWNQNNQNQNNWNQSNQNQNNWNQSNWNQNNWNQSNWNQSNWNQNNWNQNQTNQNQSNLTAQNYTVVELTNDCIDPVTFEYQWVNRLGSRQLNANSLTPVTLQPGESRLFFQTGRNQMLRIQMDWDGSRGVDYRAKEIAGSNVTAQRVESRHARNYSFSITRALQFRLN